jgi:hypothetical protein
LLPSFLLSNFLHANHNNSLQSPHFY